MQRFNYKAQGETKAYGFSLVFWKALRDAWEVTAFFLTLKSKDRERTKADNLTKLEETYCPMK